MIGERIKANREGRGLSLRALAELVGVSHSAIQKYESNQDMPGSEVAIKLARALGISLDCLFRERRLELTLPVFRKRSRLGAKKQKMIRAKVEDFLERYTAVEELRPEAHTVFSRPMATSVIVEGYAGIELIATKLREEWDLGLEPLNGLVETLESKGVKIVLLDWEADDFDGCSLWMNETIPVIVVSKSWPGDRQRFTIAHELGHLLLDRINPRLKEEIVANRFAGAFLIPEEAARTELGFSRQSFSVTELVELKQRYGASMGCWLHRAADLGIITQSKYKTIMITLNQYGWRKKEPGDQLPSEKPRRFERIVYKTLIEGIIGEGKAAELLGISITGLRSRNEEYGGKYSLGTIRS